jgi:hypothetical protein
MTKFATKRAIEMRDLARKERDGPPRGSFPVTIIRLLVSDFA